MTPVLFDSVKTRSEALHASTTQVLAKAERIVAEAAQRLEASKLERANSPQRRRARAEVQLLDRRIVAYNYWIRAIECALRIMEIDQYLAAHNYALHPTRPIAGP